MEPTFTGVANLRRDGHDHSAEVIIRYLPGEGATGVGYSSDAERYINARFGDAFAERGNDIWQTVVKLLKAGHGRFRLAKWPQSVAYTFRAEVVHLRVSEGASPEDAASLLSKASRLATERYFAAIDDGRVELKVSDASRRFEYLPSTGFDEEFIARRPCFLDYVAGSRPGFLFGFAVSRSGSIEEAPGAHPDPARAIGLPRGGPRLSHGLPSRGRCARGPGPRDAHARRRDR